MKEEIRTIYNSMVSYGFYTNVKFVRKETIESTEYAVLVDKSGTKTKVYLDLFKKHAKVILNQK